MQVQTLIKLCSLILWADEKVNEDEWNAVQNLFSKNGLDWDTNKAALKVALDDIIAAEDTEDASEQEEELTIAPIELDEGDELIEILNDLCLLIVADKEIDLSEIAIAHIIGNALGAEPELVTAAILNVAIEAGCKVNITLHEDEEADDE